MPAFTLHYLFGVKNYREMSGGSLKSIIYQYPCLYSLGLQGPDIFFYFPPNYLGKVNIGSALHDGDSRRFFANLYDSMMGLKGEPARMAAAYLAGFMGHFALDTEFHPYVYQYTQYEGPQKNDMPYYARHFDMESKLDILYLRKWKNKRPEEFRQSRTIALSAGEQKTAARMLHRALGEVYGIRQSVWKLEAAILTMRLGTAALHDNTGRKKRLVSRLEGRIFGCPLASSLIEWGSCGDPEKLLNLRHREWKNPWNPRKVSRESVPELLHKASVRFGGYLKNLQECIDRGESSPVELLDALGNRSYHSGLSL